MGKSRIVRRSNQTLTTPVCDRVKSKQYRSGLWLIVTNVQFRIILGHTRYSNRRAQIEIKKLKFEI